MFAVSLALLADAFRGKDRGTAFGAWGAVTGLAVAIGPLLGGVLTSGLSWRWIFFVNVPIGIAAAVISVMKVAQSRAPRASGPGWPGFALFTVALSSLVYALIESSQRSFTNGLVLGCFAAAAVLLAAFVIAERRSAHPMPDLTLFRLPAFSGGSVAACGLRQTVAVITRTAFTTGLNRILLAAAIIALIPGVISLTAIRSKDLAQQPGAGPAGRTATAQKATQPEQG
jgi:hypothetical protein